MGHDSEKKGHSERLFSRIFLFSIDSFTIDTVLPLTEREFHSITYHLEAMLFSFNGPEKGADKKSFVVFPFQHLLQVLWLAPLPT